MRTKKIEERFKGTISHINRLEQRVQALENNAQITRSRPLTEKEIDAIEDTQTWIPEKHTDTYPMKEIILLMLDLLGLEPKRTLEKIELIKLKTRKEKK